MLPSWWGRSHVSFWGDHPTLIFQPVAPDVIWHNYSHLYCSSRDGSRHLASSGEAAPTMGKVPCEFQADWPGCSFQGNSWDKGPSSLPLPRMVHHPLPAALDVIWHNYSHLYCSLRDGGRDLPSSGDHGAGPLWVSSRSDNLHFSAGGSWCDLALLLKLVLLLKGWWQGLAVFRGDSPYHGEGPLLVSGRSAWF